MAHVVDNRNRLFAGHVYLHPRGVAFASDWDESILPQPVAAGFLLEYLNTAPEECVGQLKRKADSEGVAGLHFYVEYPGPMVGIYDCAPACGVPGGVVSGHLAPARDC